MTAILSRPQCDNGSVYCHTCVANVYHRGSSLAALYLLSSLLTLRLLVIKSDSMGTVSVLISSSHYTPVAHVKQIDMFKHCSDTVLRSYIRLILWHSNRQDKSFTALTKSLKYVGHIRIYTTGRIIQLEIMPLVISRPAVSCGHWKCRLIYRKLSNIRRTKSQNLNDSRLVLPLSWPNLLKPGVKYNMKM